MTAKKKTWQESSKLVAFISELMRHGNTTWALEKSAAARGWVYRWRQENTEFADAFEDARTCGRESMIDEAHRRAYDGVDEPVFYKGDEVATVTKYSDSLLMFLIKQSDPTYREHFQIDHGNAGSRPFVFQMMLHPDAIKAQQEANHAR